MKNKYRIIFWGAIMFLNLTLAIFGVIRNYQLFNTNKQEVKYIVDNFNNSSLVAQYKKSNININAKLKGKDIIVTYKGVNTVKYKIELLSNSIETTIDSNDTFGKIMVQILADTISQYYNYKAESTYDLFKDFNSLKEYSIDEGIQIKELKNNKLKVEISLTYPIAKNFKQTIIDKPDTEESETNENE